jgi:uncharacterized protein (TIGR02147 family)
MPHYFYKKNRYFVIITNHMQLNIYHYTDYKKFLKAIVSNRGSQRGLLTRLAKAARCHPSYLSQAMHSNVQLTPDQAYAIALYLNFSEDEQDYFLNLLEQERAGTQELKRRIQKKMEHLQSQKENLTERLKRPALAVTEKQAFYFSNWIWTAVHVLVSIPAYQNASALAERLGMTEKKVLGFLQQLEGAGFVTRSGGVWKHASGELHLSKHNPFVVAHHNHWRQQAVLDAQNTESKGIHFTGVYALSKRDLEILRDKMLKLLDEITQTVTPSPEEEVACINCDFFSF